MTVLRQGPEIHVCSPPYSFHWSGPFAGSPEWVQGAKRGAGEGTVWQCDGCSAVWRTKQGSWSGCWSWKRLGKRAARRMLRRVAP